MQSSIPVVILCGGKGTRMGAEEIPKPLFKIGDKPILWHIIKIFENFGFRDFIFSLGYKKEKITEYFRNYKGANIRFVDTGIDTKTGGRVKKIERFIENYTFFVTYGDGLADINLMRLLKFHKQHRKIATLTCVRPYSQFGILSIDSHSNTVTRFLEKPKLDHWVNGGFFIFDRKVFKYIKDSDILESESFSRLVAENQLVAYKHNGFWECMDTYKDNLRLNQLWSAGNAPWVVWRKRR